MRIIPCQDQKTQTLEEFYGDLSRRDGFVLREGSKAMLGLIARLQSMSDDKVVFGLTSHHRLVLLAEDTYQSPWFVIISALDSQNYHVEFRMPAAAAPWPGAYVRGECRTQDDAVRMIETAMERSEGWFTKPGSSGPG
jgi:hypothetical protein